MRRFLILTASLLAAAMPAAAQIVTPTLTPPCIAKHCPGASGPTRTAPPSRYCPQGTVYVPQKGTCKVLPPPPGRGN